MGKISEWSFLRFLRFFAGSKNDTAMASDKEFENKINAIKNEIANGNRDIASIAEKSGCTLYECIYKIAYLKNKQVIPDFYMDRNSMMIKDATPEQKKLLDKYSGYIYKDHASFDDLVLKAFQFRTEGETLEEFSNHVSMDLEYLFDCGLLNGVIYDKIDRKLTYYSVEKKMFAKKMITLSCPNCGALVDINLYSKAKCSYCGTYVDGNEETKRLVDQGIIKLDE